MSMLAFAMRSSPRPRVPPRRCELRCRSSSRSPLFARTSVRVLAMTPFVRPLFSWSYELLFPQALWIDIDTKCHGGVPCGAARSSGLTRSIRSKSLRPARYTLFGICKEVNPSRFKQLRTLSAKHSAWGYLADLDRSLFRSCGPRPLFATWTRPAHPTIIAISSRFQVHG